MIPMMPPEAIALIKSYEKCELHSYQDAAGNWTIGWGHKGPEVTPNLVWTQQQADAQFLKDLAVAEKAVQDRVLVPLTGNQYGALVSLVFNCGAIAVDPDKHIGIYLADQDYRAAADFFTKWDHAGGMVEPGLLARREAERALFLQPDSGAV